LTTDICIEAVQEAVESYNPERPHTALDDNTPDEFYYKNLPALLKRPLHKSAVS
jgi:transposase InsO family protein